MKEIKFDDDTFALNKQRVEEICKEIIKRNLHKKMVWNCFGHINQGDLDLYKLMAKSGCLRIAYGVESGSQRILNEIKKSINIKKAKQTIENCKKAGMYSYIDFMIGFPGETEKDINQSMKAALYLDPDYIQVSICVPYPGTRMFNDGLKQSFLLNPYDFEKYASCEPVIKSGLSKKKVMKLYRKFWRRFYLRPKYVMKVIRRMLRSRKEFKKSVKGFVSFYKRFIKN